MRPAPRRERRAAWALDNREYRGQVDLDTGEESRRPRTPWGSSGQRLPLPNPLVAMALAKRRSVNQESLLLASLGFNRAQRLALRSKKGPRRMLEHRRPTSTPAESFLPGKGTWNRHALRIELQRRLQARMAEHARLNVWWRRALRVLRFLPHLAKWYGRRLWLKVRGK